MRPTLIERALPESFVASSQGVGALEAALPAWRFACPEGRVDFVDGFAGHQSHDPSAMVGDFIVWTRRGQPAYQLAVVVDDHRHGVTQIVRGDDLLDSAARQILLARALGHEPPAQCHLPLVRGSDGKRLAKRHGDTRLDHYRAAGVVPERVIGLVAWWGGLTPGGRQPMDIFEFRARFTLDTIPKGPVVFTSEDDAWLRARS
jgi:glutamyl-tRNA synthetase